MTREIVRRAATLFLLHFQSRGCFSAARVELNPARPDVHNLAPSTIHLRTPAAARAARARSRPPCPPPTLMEPAATARSFPVCDLAADGAAVPGPGAVRLGALGVPSDRVARPRRQLRVGRVPGAPQQAVPRLHHRHLLPHRAVLLLPREAEPPAPRCSPCGLSR